MSLFCNKKGWSEGGYGWIVNIDDPAAADHPFIWNFLFTERPLTRPSSPEWEDCCVMDVVMPQGIKAFLQPSFLSLIHRLPEATIRSHFGTTVRQQIFLIELPFRTSIPKSYTSAILCYKKCLSRIPNVQHKTIDTTLAVDCQIRHFRVCSNTDIVIKASSFDLSFTISYNGS